MNFQTFALHNMQKVVMKGCFVGEKTTFFECLLLEWFLDLKKYKFECIQFLK